MHCYCMVLGALGETVIGPWGLRLINTLATRPPPVPALPPFLPSARRLIETNQEIISVQPEFKIPVPPAVAGEKLADTLQWCLNEKGASYKWVLRFWEKDFDAPGA